MLKAWLKSGLAVTALLSLGSAGFAHGGNYKGPGDTVPPNLGGGGDTTPPGNPGGPATPGPGAPTTTGGPKGPATGGVPGAPTGAGGGGVRPASGGFGKRAAAGEGFERWEFWWEHNKDPFLQLKARLAGNVVSSSGAAFLAGGGRVKSSEAISANRPSPSEVKNTMIPAFVEALSETNPDIVDSAVLAIGRTLQSQDAKDALPALIQTLGHSAKTARESATLSLGVLGSTDALPVLRELLNDTPEGRKLTKQDKEVEKMVRAFAAAAIGLIGDSSAVPDLKKVIADQKIAVQDVKALAILALGMMSEGHEDIARFLVDLMEDRSLDKIVRAQAPIALGRLNRQANGSPAARGLLGKVVQLFEDDKADNDLRRSLAVCLGMLATVEDSAAVESLMNAVAKGSDDQTRHFSIMALAEIGARDTEPDKHPEVHAKLKEFFVRELTAPKRITHLPYGSLGLAVYSRNEKLPDSARDEAANRIVEQFKSNKNPSYQGAMAISLGLLNFKLASQEMWKTFEESNDPQLKGYIAVSLGLMRDTNRADAIRAEILKKGLETKYRLQLARSLGLMGDAKANATLIEYLQSAETLAESSSAAQALGLIGDKSAVPSLIEILRNKSKQPLARGFSAVALGIIAEKTELSWNAVFSVDSNYRAKVEALSEILDIL